MSFFMWIQLTASISPILADGASYTKLSDAIPQLANFTLSSPSTYRPNLGGMNLTRCCLLAINSSFDVENGNLSLIDTSFLSPDTTPASFLLAAKNGQFPCGATFNGDLAGAPLVKASYPWCSTNCKGWQISQAKKLQQWIGPMIAFILPCLVFCLSVPRRRKLEVSYRLFQSQQGSSWAFLVAPARFLVSVLIVMLDTLIWLSMCFAFAAPMILSGVYEAFWDHRVLGFLNAEHKSVTIETRARLLHIILVGNLDLKGNETLPHDESGPWEDVDDLVPKVRRDPTSTKVYFPLGEEAEITSQNKMSNRSLPLSRTQTRLRTMLGTQSSFGSAVGAPVVFFAGGFVYTLFDTLSYLGDNNTAHALAFGMWWMIIPHVAIVSSLLLAGNNPSTFEAVVGKPAIEHPSVLGIFALSYPSRYKTEWMWFRGRSKYLWIERALRKHNDESASPDFNIVATFSLLDWVVAVLLTVILITVPFVLAFLTSFYTPNIGVSCRSLTVLIYFITQILQLGLWVWVLKTSTVCSGGVLHSPMKWTRSTKCNACRCLIWWILATVFGVSSIFTAIGGTIFQLLGVYRNCLCAIPIQYWRNPDDADVYVSLGTNNAADIMAARTWWVGMGGVAVVFLVINCYLAWWYQSRLRGLFLATVAKPLSIK